MADRARNQTEQPTKLVPRSCPGFVRPTQTAGGQRAPALKLGDPRVMVLFQALCQFGWTWTASDTARYASASRACLGPHTVRGR